LVKLITTSLIEADYFTVASGEHGDARTKKPLPLATWPHW